MSDAKLVNVDAKRRRRIMLAALAAGLVGIAGTWGALHYSAPMYRSPSAYTDGERYVFMPSHNTRAVAVLDGKTERVVAQLELSGVPVQTAVSEAAGVIVAAFADRNALDVVALADASRPPPIELPIFPESLVMSPDGYLIAVADSKRGAVTIVSLQQRKPLFTVSGFGDARHLTFSADGSQLYVADGGALEVAFVDLVQQKVIERVPLARNGKSTGLQAPAVISPVTRTPDGRLGFVSMKEANAVAVIDLTVAELVKWLPVGHAPTRAYGTADGRLMLVPNEGDSSVSVIDTSTLQVSATLPGARDVAAISTGWFESHAFVMSRSEKRIVVLDLMKFDKVGEIALPGSAGAGVVNSAGQKLYVPVPDTDETAVIDTRTYTLATLVRGVGHGPWSALMARSNNYCH